MSLCENCHEHEASVQVRDMKSNIVNLCSDCAGKMQGAEILKIEG